MYTGHSFVNGNRFSLQGVCMYVFYLTFTEKEIEIVDIQEFVPWCVVSTMSHKVNG